MNQHYIPQFWIKNFCQDRKDGFVDYYNKKTNERSFRHSSEIFFCHDLYKETDSEDGDTQYIERELSRFENDIQPIFKKISNDKEIVLDSNEYEMLAIFLYLQYIRSYNVKKGMEKNAKDEELVSSGISSNNPDENLKNWRKTILEFSKTRCCNDIENTSLTKLDRCVFDFIYKNYSLIFLESKEINFYLADSIPVVMEGDLDGFKIPSFLLFTLSPKRIALFIFKKLKINKWIGFPFSQSQIKDPIIEKNEKKFLKMKPRVIYKKQVRIINDGLINNAIEGYVIA